MNSYRLPAGVKFLGSFESGEYKVVAPDGSFTTVSNKGTLAERILYQLAAAFVAAPAAAAPDDGRAIIEAALLKATRANPSDAPFGFDTSEAALWHQAQASAYRHALEMMEAPSVTMQEAKGLRARFVTDSRFGSRALTVYDDFGEAMKEFASAGREKMVMTREGRPDVDVVRYFDNYHDVHFDTPEVETFYKVLMRDCTPDAATSAERRRVEVAAASSLERKHGLALQVEAVTKPGAGDDEVLRDEPEALRP